MTVWGAWTSHLRIGIDVWVDPPLAPSTNQVTVLAQLHVQCDSAWNFADNQKLVLGGHVTAEWAWYNNLRANQIHTFSLVGIPNQGLAYTNGPTYHFSAALSGIYLGGIARLDYLWTLPPRPIRPPAAPATGPAASGISATAANLSWPSTVDSGGSLPDLDELHVSADAAWTKWAHVSSQAGNSRPVGPLAPGAQFWARSRIHNAAGWSAWSPTTTFQTLPFTASRPTGTADPVSITITWPRTVPGGTAIGWEAQLSRNAAFTDIVHTSTLAAMTTPTARFTGLRPGTTYYARVRALASSGWGAYSPALTIATRSGAKARVGGQWRDAVPHARVGGQWQPVQVKKGRNNAWTL